MTRDYAILGFFLLKIHHSLINMVNVFGGRKDTRVGDRVLGLPAERERVMGFSPFSSPAAGTAGVASSWDCRSIPSHLAPLPTAKGRL